MKINKLAVAIFFSVAGSISMTSLQAQEAKTVFVNMPDSLSTLLTKVNREDCIDFLESKMRAQVENRFGKKSEMTDLSKDYIRMQMSPQTTWQMKLQPYSLLYYRLATACSFSVCHFTDIERFPEYSGTDSCL